MKSKFILIFLIAASVGLTANIMENWWSGRDNNLLSNENWIVGKERGKYLFYTYQYMLEPFKHNKVNLNSHMGYQELLYNKAETNDRRLKKLTFDMHVGGGAYLWVLMRKDGQRAFACRLSHRKKYEPGFYTFDVDGSMVEYIPFPDGMPKLEQSKIETVDLELKDGVWVVMIDGKQVGTAPDPQFKNGYFGFRGSGVVRQKNTIEAIRMVWEVGGKERIEYEDFAAPHITISQWVLIILCATLVIFLRYLRTWNLSRILPHKAVKLYIYIDLALASFLLLAITLLIQMHEPAKLGLSLLLLEVFSFVAFTWLIRKHGQKGRISPVGLFVFGSIGCAVAVASLYIHGEWAGRKQYPPAVAVAVAYPEAVIKYPDTSPGGQKDIVKFKPFDVSFGNPYTTGDIVFDRQEVSVDFIMPPDTTFDVCLQQQSFLTRGDPKGEPLPLQRRLIRLSTVKSVGNGVATLTGRQPEPFIPIEGELLANQLNTINIKSLEKGLLVSLNGTETPLMKSIFPLGYGETILMSHEQPVTVQRLEIHNTNEQEVKQYLWLLLGLLSFPIVIGIGWVFFRITGGTSLGLTSLGAVAVTFPLYAYLSIILFCEPSLLSRIALARITLLDFAIVTSAWAMLYWIPLHIKRLKYPALIANIFVIIHIICITFLIWDIFLPAENILKTRFASEHSKPGELIDHDASLVPWYASNKRIGGNIYIWLQQFEGRWIPVEKQPGEIRVFVLGGSQAWGSGAKSTAETFAGLLYQKGKKAGWPLEVVNASANGAGVATVKDIFLGILLRYKPDIIILDIGLNDSASLKNSTKVDSQLALFREIAEACIRNNIDLILVHEPMSLEGPFVSNKALYSGFAATANKNGFQIVDPRQQIARAEHIEIVWWDAAHLAPRGQTVMADTIFPALQNSVKNILAARSGQ